MDLEKLKAEVKREGCQKPQIMMVTPEIRTCNEVARSPVVLKPTR